MTEILQLNQNKHLDQSDEAFESIDYPIYFGWVPGSCSVDRIRRTRETKERVTILVIDGRNPTDLCPQS